jgi:hypothetical protein
MSFYSRRPPERMRTFADVYGRSNDGREQAAAGVRMRLSAIAAYWRRGNSASVAGECDWPKHFLSLCELTRGKMRLDPIRDSND